MGPNTDNPVKSISEDPEKLADSALGEKRQPPSQRRNDRQARSAKWVDSLRTSDVNRLWTDLHRIVSHHPLVRASRSAGLLVEEGAGAARSADQRMVRDDAVQVSPETVDV